MQAKKGQRRRHAEELKAQVLGACEAPGVSVASVALAYGLNANLVHKWRRERGEGRRALVPAAKAMQGEAMQRTFIPVSVGAQPVAQPRGDIQVKLKRGALQVEVSWPVSAAGACAAWLGEVLL